MKTNTLHLVVEAGVRYWEDATVNGVEDAKGSLIPFREGGMWTPKIDLENGKIIGWPEGTTASIHYKVCDDGEYWLADPSGELVFKYRDHYVPDILSVGDRGYGDYIILKVGADGMIEGWKKPELDRDEWEAVSVEEAASE